MARREGEREGATFLRNESNQFKSLPPPPSLRRGMIVALSRSFRLRSLPYVSLGPTKDGGKETASRW